MLEKDMYDSWKSRMELYMLNRPHGRMILESVEQGPLIWPSVEVEGVTRLKKYSELSAAEAIQADCDVKATNIILQGLPPEKGETLRDFYLRFSLLLNDMNMYNMKLEQFQVNTKFLNTLPPEWSKFVTDLVRDLHTTNVDQLHAYLGQHEYHANEVRLMNERASDPLALISQHQLNRTPYQHHQPLYQQSQFQPQATSYQSSPYATTYHNSQFVSSGPSSLTHSISYPGTDTSSLVNHNAYVASSSAPQIAYALMDQQSSEYSPPKAGLIVPVFQKGDDPIDSINHMISFLTSVNFVSAGSSRPFTSGQGGAQGKQRVITCYNCKGEGHMSKQCTKPMRKCDAEWFKDKVLLVQAQANGQVLQEEELEFLADPDCGEINSSQDRPHGKLVTLWELALEKEVKELNNIVFKRNQSAQTVHMLIKPQVFYNHATRQALGFQNPRYLKKAQQLKPNLYDGSVIGKADVIVVPDSENMLMHAEESQSKMIAKQNDPQLIEKKVITKPIDYATLNQLSTDFNTR
nr:hypothetical protein [Tanacetum cinerariifolium]